MLMNKRCSVCLIIICVFQILMNEVYSQSNNKNCFSPDRSINEHFFLRSPNSTKKILGNTFLSTDNTFPSVYVMSITKHQYLKMIVFAGDVRNCISQFEVGYCSDDKYDTLKPMAFIDTIFTESGIFLGICKNDLIKLKGIPNEITRTNDTIIVKYIIDDFEKSAFLKAYNMPLYFAEYCIVQDKLIKFKFGFEYP